MDEFDFQSLDQCFHDDGSPLFSDFEEEPQCPPPPPAPQEAEQPPEEEQIRIPIHETSSSPYWEKELATQGMKPSWNHFSLAIQPDGLEVISRSRIGEFMVSCRDRKKNCFP